MNTKMRFLIILMLGFSACQPIFQPPPAVDSDIDTSRLELKLADSLKLTEGEVPEDWEKVLLTQGFYIAFPTTPKTDEDKNKTLHKLKRKDYVLVAKVNDLSQDSLLEAYAEDKPVYYYAVVNDLVQTLDLADMPTQAVRKDFYRALSLYEGLEAEIHSPDAHVFVRTILIDKHLYTFSFISWEPLTPLLTQTKDRFFYSFGKELIIQ